MTAWILLLTQRGVAVATDSTVMFGWERCPDDVSGGRYLVGMGMIQRSLVLVAERACTAADRFAWSSRVIGCGAQGTGRCLAEWSVRKDQGWKTGIWT